MVGLPASSLLLMAMPFTFTLLEFHFDGQPKFYVHGSTVITRILHALHADICTCTNKHAYEGNDLIAYCLRYANQRCLMHMLPG